MTVQDINNREDLTFCENDADFIKEYIGEKAQEYDTFFVKVENGDYSEIYGMYGIIPNLYKKLYRIKWPQQLK